MEEEYQIFQKGFNKIINLISDVDENLAKQHKNVVRSMPAYVLDKIEQLEDFSEQTEKYNTEMIMFNNKLVLDFTRYSNFCNAEMEVHRIFEQHVFPKVDKKGEYVQEEPLVLYKLSMRNTPKKKNNLEVHYEERNGKYVLVGISGDEAGIVDVTYTLSLEKVAGKFYLISTKTSRGWEIYSKRCQISFDEIISAVEDEDDYQEDLEVEFEADFDL